VWLTDGGLALLAADRRVLSVELLADSVAELPRADRVALLRGIQALLATEPRTSVRQQMKENNHERQPQLRVLRDAD
jgi:hypothetical protein